jgi:hypothetical protein
MWHRLEIELTRSRWVVVAQLEVALVSGDGEDMVARPLWPEIR